MPYGKLSDLPDSVREHFPMHAHQIYRGAYNFAKEQYQKAGQPSALRLELIAALSMLEEISSV